MSDPTVHPRADADETQALPRTPPSWGPTAAAASPAEETAGLRSEGLSPSGRTWFVTRIPCPRVVLNTDHVTVDGQRVALAEKQTPRDAATQRLKEIAVALRGLDGAVRAAISVGDNGAVRNTIVTARGEVFDDNEQFASGGSTISRPPTRDRPSRKVLVAIAAAAVAAVVVTAIAISAATGDSSDPSPVAAPYQATPTEYPLPAPVGHAQRASWSAPIDGQSVPLVASSGQVITVSSGALVALDPKTGAPLWSSPVPAEASGAILPGGLHLSVIDGAESVVTASAKTLWWWPVSGSAHDAHQVDLPASAALSFAGSTPLVTVPDHHAQLLAGGQLHDYVVPAGAVAVAGQGDTVIAASSAGQVWAITAAARTSPPAPWQLATPAGATALATVAGVAVPFSASGPPRHGVLVLIWYTADVNTRIVGAVDADTHAYTAPALTVPAPSVASPAFYVSPHGVLGLLGPVLVNADTGKLQVLANWQSRTVLDDAAYGSANGVNSGVSPAGEVFATGSGTTPAGVSGDIFLVTVSAQGVSTVYGLPKATAAAPGQTAPVPPLQTAGPTPAPAASPPPPPPPPVLPPPPGAPPAPPVVPPVVPPHP